MRDSIQDRIKRIRGFNRNPTPIGSDNSLPSQVLQNSGMSFLGSTRSRPWPDTVSSQEGLPSRTGPPSDLVPRYPQPPTGMQPRYPQPPSGLTPRYTSSRFPAPSTQPSPIVGTPSTPGASSGTPGISPYGQPLTGPVPQDQWQTILARDPQLTSQIRNAYLSYYGDIPGGEGTIVGLLNKIYNEGYPVDRVMQLIREQGYNVPDMLQQAADLVQLEYGPQQSAIERAIAEIQRQLGIDVNTQQNYGQIYDESINRIYQDLQRQLTGLNAQIPGIWNQASQQGQDAYANALSGVQSGFDQSVQDMQSNAAKLGIGAGLDETIASLAQSIAPNQQALASEQGAVGSMFSGLGGLYSASGNRLQQIRASEGAQQRANLANQVLATIGQLQSQAQGATLEQQGLLSDLAANRGAATRSAYSELETQGYDRARQEAIDRLNEEIARGTLGVQQGQLGIQQGQLGIEQARLAIEQANAQGNQALINAQVAQIYAQITSMGVQDDVARAQVQQILTSAGLNQAQITQTLAQAGLLSAQTQETGANTGLIGANTSNVNAQTGTLLSQLLNPQGNQDTSTGYGALSAYFPTIGATPEFQTSISTIINTAELQAFSNPSSPNPEIDAYNRALQLVTEMFGTNTGGVFQGQNQQGWLGAIRVYFGR